jgi:hypothetical protein
MPADRDALAHSLMPLKLAAELVLQRVYEGRTPGRNRREDLLNSIASTLAAIGAVYEYDESNSHRAPRPIPSSAIGAGVFSGGAQELHFLDGRPPIRRLAIAPETVSETVEALKRAAL